MTVSGPDTPSDPTFSRDQLRRIARDQKVILGCIVMYVLSIIFQFALPRDLRPILGIGMLGVIVVGMVFVFMLATKIYGTGMGVLLGLVTLIPLLGLIALVRVNGKATSVLKQHGIPVGLLGATGDEL